MTIVLVSARFVVNFFNFDIIQSNKNIKHFLNLRNILIELSCSFDDDTKFEKTLFVIFYNVNKFKNDVIIFFFKKRSSFWLQYYRHSETLKQSFLFYYSLFDEATLLTCLIEIQITSLLLHQQANFQKSSILQLQ